MEPITPKFEQYLTPKYAVKCLLDVLGPIPHGVILDPCCGNGRILEEIKDSYPERESQLIGSDIDSEILQACNVGIVSKLPFEEQTTQAVLTVTNPPFSLALELAEHALKHNTNGSGKLALLLRLAFLESKKRVDFNRNHPCDIFVFPKRLVFDVFVDGKVIHRKSSDADKWAYAWFVWGPGHGGHWKLL
jgi:hypothetical protein